MPVVHTNVEDTDRKVTLSTGTTNSIVAALPPHAAGDLLAIEVFVGISFPINAPGGGWTVHGNVDAASGVFALLTKIAASSSETAPTVTISESNVGSLKTIARKFTGHNASTPVNAIAAIERSGGENWDAPALTTTVDGCFVFLGGVSEYPSNFTSGDQPSGTTLGYHNASNDSLAVDAYFTQATAGAIGTRTWTNAVNAKTAFAFAIAPAPDGGAPLFTEGPKAKAVTNSGYQVEMTANEDCTARLVVTAPGAAQPNNAAFDASSESVALTAGTPGSITHTG